MCNLSVQARQDPYFVIANFYYLIELPRIRKFIDSLMAALYKEQKWINKSPADFLIFYDQVIELIEAAYIIREMNYKGSQGILTAEKSTEEQLMNPDHYCLPLLKNIQWDYFPRSLTRKEFINPYRAINKFFKNCNFNDWKKKIYNILHIALSPDKLDSIGEIVDVHNIQKCLNKLTEACYLIYVRELSENSYTETDKSYLNEK